MLGFKLAHVGAQLEGFWFPVTREGTGLRTFQRYFLGNEKAAQSFLA